MAPQCRRSTRPRSSAPARPPRPSFPLSYSSWLSLRLLFWRTGTPVTHIGGKNMLPHPAEKRLALPRNPVPSGVEGVVAPVIAVGIGWVRAALRLDDGIDRPIWQD